MLRIRHLFPVASFAVFAAVQAAAREIAGFIAATAAEDKGALVTRPAVNKDVFRVNRNAVLICTCGCH
jgi:hypothetical protein